MNLEGRVLLGKTSSWRSFNWIVELQCNIWM